MLKKKAVLVLADGSAYFANGMGAYGVKTGELVFNTSMTGYQEALTDPSYAGQILLMTYPLIGNYGFNQDWCESQKVWLEGFCTKTYEPNPNHICNQNSLNLDKYLQDAGVGGIYDLDTRQLTRKIRNHGVIASALEVYEKEPDINHLIQLAKKTQYSQIDFVSSSSIKEPKTIGTSGKKVALIDYGAKGNIVRELLARKCQITIYPHDTSAQTIISSSPDGIVLSNGPGDPALLNKQIEQIKQLLDYPIMGICLGHQLLARAIGAKTYKLKFGHRGANHPVLDKIENRVYITTQNHGFAVDENSIPKDWKITHINLNDNTVEGIEHNSLPMFSIQYHPEAHPGPQDSTYLFDKFVSKL